MNPRLYFLLAATLTCFAPGPLMAQEETLRDQFTEAVFVNANPHARVGGWSIRIHTPEDYERLVEEDAEMRRQQKALQDRIEQLNVEIADSERGGTNWRKLQEELTSKAKENNRIHRARKGLPKYRVVRATSDSLVLRKEPDDATIMVIPFRFISAIHRSAADKK